jgi:hypothetical protein
MDKYQKRRNYFDENERPKITKKVPYRVELLLARSYLMGYLEGPLEAITDEQLSRLRGLGAITLFEIRQVIPAPAKPKLKIMEICPLCLADKKVFCPRDVDAQCVECGQKFCGAHIGQHLKEAHCISLTLDHCREPD